MKSADSCKGVNLEQDLPTTREDVLGLRLARQSCRLSFEEYLDFLTNFVPLTADALRARKDPSGNQPFEL